MVDVKKFAACLAFNDKIRNLFFDMAEARGINSSWDVYHILADEETVPEAEIKVMSEIYDSHIAGTELETEYNNSVIDFHSKLREKISKAAGRP